MYTVGEIVKIHENGRINYVGQLTNEDGSDPNVERAVLASHALELAGEDDDSEKIERALEDALNAEMEGFDDEYDDFDDDECDDFDNDDYFDSTKLPPYLKVETSIGKRKQHFKAEFSQKKMKVKEYPDNFSKVDTSLSETELKKKFPNFINALKEKIEVKVVAGEMLYIPAGWFHEVKSKSYGNTSSTQSGHMAFNYWFHPPSVDLIENKVSFDKPYRSDFWVNDYASRNN